MDSDSELIDAVRRGNTKKIKMCLRREITQEKLYFCFENTNKRKIIKVLAAKLTINEQFFEHLCQQLKRPSYIKKLLQYKGDCCKNSFILTKAIAQTAPVKTIQVLLKHGSDANEVDFNGHTSVLHKVIQSDGKWGVDVLKMLLRNGAQPNFTVHSQVSALRLAIDRMSVAITLCTRNDYKYDKIIILLKAGANPNWIDIDKIQKPPIFSALSCVNSPYQLYMVKQLISHNANIQTSHDSFGRSVLITAINENCDEEIIKLLITNGCDVNQSDLKNLTPLHYAVGSYEHALLIKIVKVLLQHGASLNFTSKSGMTPLMRTIWINSTEIQLINFLIQRGSDVGIQNIDGDSALHFAVRSVNYENVVPCLLFHGANPNAINSDGKTPLMIGIERSLNPQIIKLLVDAGTNLNQQDIYGFTALHFAVTHTAVLYNLRLTTDLLEILCQRGANPNLVDYQGRNPLVLYKGYDTYAVEIFIQSGVDFNITDINNNSGWHKIAKTPLPIEELKRIFTDKENLLSLKDEFNNTVFYYLTKNFIKQKESLEFIKILCERCDHETLMTFSAKIPLILYESLDCLSDVIDYPEYFDTLLMEPFTMIDNVFEIGPVFLNSFKCKPSILCNLVTSLISKKDNCQNSLDTQVLIKSIKKLEEYGFALFPTNPECFSPLAAVFLSLLQAKIKDDDTIDEAWDTRTFNLSKYLIERGADMTAANTLFQDIYFSEESKPEYFQIPDALWMALLSCCLDGVRLLLNFWPHQPLSLLVYLLPYINSTVIQRQILCKVYPTLASAGPLPIGSPIYQRICHLLQRRDDFLGNINAHFKSMHSTPGAVPSSLLYLSRIAVRASMEEGADLPQRLNNLVPPGMEGFLLVDFKTTVVNLDTTDQNYAVNYDEAALMDIQLQFDNLMYLNEVPPEVTDHVIPPILYYVD